MVSSVRAGIVRSDGVVAPLELFQEENGAHHSGDL